MLYKNDMTATIMIGIKRIIVAVRIVFRFPSFDTLNIDIGQSYYVRSELLSIVIMLPKTVLYELRCFLVERKISFYSIPLTSVIIGL